MIEKYRVDIYPLEPYTFGTEQGSKFTGTTQTGKESYIIASANVPDQTTILGTLRYVALAKNGLLNTDFTYSREQQTQMKELIGAESFSFESGREQEFGHIRSISPLFLTKEDEYYVKTPAHYRKSDEEDNYVPMRLTTETICTSNGKIKLPYVYEEAGDIRCDYNAKCGLVGGYISLKDRKRVIPDNVLFQKSLQTGNRADHPNDTDKEGFFKREVVVLKKGFAFSVFVQAEEDCFPESTIVYMGRKQSAFRMIFHRTEECDLEKLVEKAFHGDKDTWYYALSDIYMGQKITLSSFSIVKEKRIRNLETNYSESGYKKKRRKIDKQIYLVESGSVFKDALKLQTNPEKYKMIGYNSIVKLGGAQ